MAGGKSSRMGRNKAFVLLQDRPLIEHILERTAQIPGVDETILITNHAEEYAHLNLPIYPDLIPSKGALGGVLTALHHSRTEAVLIVACDMPFVSPALMRHMSAVRAEPSGPYDVIAPRVGDLPQGTLAVYAKTCIPAICQRIEEGRLKLFGFYDLVKVRYLDEPETRQYDPQGLSLLNVNTPDELDAANRLAADSSA
ncbi:MAG TPA: molybdenum cofactor guanylyltransferase [Aggregatilinea sp.]|nr:molybdenum cofactor guanylyltransferase [Aggregatilinea sp.]